MILPKLDKNFYPMIKALEDFEKQVNAQNPKDILDITLVVERNNGYNYVYTYKGLKDGIDDESNFKIAERLAKTILWICGGYKISVSGSEYIYRRLKCAYSAEGERAFDKDFMEKVYERAFEVEFISTPPLQNNSSIKVGGFLKGCRSGFDAGGSDRKVSAVIDGEVVYSEEVVWFPKKNPDPNYQYEGILDSFRTAAS